jgi:hypothetical protein
LQPQRVQFFLKQIWNWGAYFSLAKFEEFKISNSQYKSISGAIMKHLFYDQMVHLDKNNVWNFP